MLEYSSMCSPFNSSFIVLLLPFPFLEIYEKTCHRFFLGSNTSKLHSIVRPSRERKLIVSDQFLTGRNFFIFLNIY